MPRPRRCVTLREELIETGSGRVDRNRRVFHGLTSYDDILAEADCIADRRHCFIEADVSAIDDPDRRW